MNKFVVEDPSKAKHRLFGDNIAALFKIVASELTKWRKYAGEMAQDMEAKIDEDGSVTVRAEVDPLLKDSSSLAKEIPNSFLLNGSQRNAANGTSLGNGGIQNCNFFTFNWVFVWIPAIIDVPPAMKSP